MAIDIYVLDEQTSVSVTNQTMIIRETEAGEGSSEIYLRISEGFLQYSTDNATWNNLTAVQNGKDGKDGQDGDDGLNGIGIENVIKTATNGLVDTYTITFTDESITTFTIKNGADGQDGSDGQDGERGSRILKITTATTSYSTTVGGFKPTYRIPLSNVLSESGADDVKVGDVIWRSYYHYPVGYVDENYVYLGSYVSIRGATGAAGDDGEDGITPHIGDNGNWFIGETDTGVKAEGQDGSDASVTSENIKTALGYEPSNITYDTNTKALNICSGGQ